jgi:pimeloyl-ACP methyl ester carboxylesterase
VRLAIHRPPGLVLTEHEFEVPLDHSRPDGTKLTLFAREVVGTERAGEALPWLLFLQGGPGFEAARPLSRRDPTWLEPALRRYRVLMLDQRGTGRSSPVGDMAGLTPREQADRLALFRADAIVRDAEVVRGALGIDRWTVLGQSFGGFCVVSYLSLAPDGLDAALVTGGLPPLERHVDDVYSATYRRVVDKNRAYYARYPEDRDRVRAIVERLDAGDVRLPTGERLSARRFRQLGMLLGTSTGAERLHYIVELPVDSPAFRHDVAAESPFARNPLYAVVHEACYASGCVTRWSAERVMPDEVRVDETMFTGEHVFPWMFDEIPALRPLRDAAGLLAERDWPALYDPETLRHNQVPAAALVYAEDMYVERTFSEETAAHIRGLRAWVTNEYEHDGLRADGERVLGRLLDFLDGTA